MAIIVYLNVPHVVSVEDVVAHSVKDIGKQFRQVGEQRLSLSINVCDSYRLLWWKKQKETFT